MIPRLRKEFLIRETYALGMDGGPALPIPACLSGTAALPRIPFPDTLPDAEVLSARKDSLPITPKVRPGTSILPCGERRCVCAINAFCILLIYLNHGFGFSTSFTGTSAEAAPDPSALLPADIQYGAFPYWARDIAPVTAKYPWFSNMHDTPFAYKRAGSETAERTPPASAICVICASTLQSKLLLSEIVIGDSAWTNADTDEEEVSPDPGG